MICSSFMKVVFCNWTYISLQNLIGVKNGLHKGAIQRKVISWSQHPEYVSGYTAYYDVAIAVADLAIEYNDYVRPIRLPTTPVVNGDVFADDFVILAGKSINIVQLFCFKLFLCRSYVFIYVYIVLQMFTQFCLFIM